MLTYEFKVKTNLHYGNSANSGSKSEVTLIYVAVRNHKNKMHLMIMTLCA